MTTLELLNMSNTDIMWVYANKDKNRKLKTEEYEVITVDYSSGVKETSIRHKIV